MAGTPLGTLVPASSFGAMPQRDALPLTSSRTRRNHGVFVLGGQVAAVYSSRRRSGDPEVSFTIGHGQMMFGGGLTTAQARRMAVALVAAAEAVEAVREG